MRSISTALSTEIVCPGCGKRRTVLEMMENEGYWDLNGNDHLWDLASEPVEELFDPHINITYDCCDNPGIGVTTFEINIKPARHNITVIAFTTEIDGRLMLDMDYKVE